VLDSGQSGERGNYAALAETHVMDYATELATAHEAAIAAGERITADAARDLRAEPTTTRKENVNDLVTAADEESQAVITETITAAFPADTVVGEEGDRSTDRNSEREWVVDPIDGTSNFAMGFPYYCVSIAFREAGETRVGVVFSPGSALDRCWYAVREEGAFLSRDPDPDPAVWDADDCEGLPGDPITVSDHDRLDGALVCARLSERNAVRRESDLGIVSDLLDRDSKYRRVASAALNVCHVASGAADGYIVPSINDWDIAAAALILREAGGRARVRPSREADNLGVVVSNGTIQGALETVVDDNLGSTTHR